MFTANANRGWTRVFNQELWGRDLGLGKFGSGWRGKRKKFFMSGWCANRLISLQRKNLRLTVEKYWKDLIKTKWFTLIGKDNIVFPLYLFSHPCFMQNGSIYPSWKCACKWVLSTWKMYKISTSRNWAAMVAWVPCRFPRETGCFSDMYSVPMLPRQKITTSPGKISRQKYIMSWLRFLVILWIAHLSLQITRPLWRAKSVKRKTDKYDNEVLAAIGKFKSAVEFNPLKPTVSGKR